MKKIISLLLAFITTLFFSLNSSAAISTDPMSWYTCPTSGGKRPSMPSETPYLSEYEAYALGKDEKTVYLTFDAGYENGNVEKIVDTLERHKANAAFFILKGLIDDAPELVDRMIKDNFLICNHSTNHPDMTKFSDFKNFKKELTDMEDYYREKTGKEISKFYRPPEGRLSEQNLAWAQEMGYKTILWSLAYADWNNENQPDPENSINLIMKRMHPGAIILLHPTSATNAQILDELLTRLEKEGYRFGSLEELKK